MIIFDLDGTLADCNEYYRKNPPETVLDDLGIDHAIHVPLPTKYTKKPCTCGITHKWENPETFILAKLSFGKKIKTCITCGDTLLLNIYKD